MPKFSEYEAVGCSDDPASRVKAAVSLYRGDPVGLKYYGEKERDGLKEALKNVSARERNKVRLVRCELPKAKSR